MIEWSKIRGHQRIKDALERAVDLGRLHHALLLAGPEGVGKQALALALAAALNCERRPKDQWAPACGSCNSCHKIAQSLHPDVIVVEPEGNILKFIKIDRIRQLQKSAMSSPYEGRDRVIILADAHEMTDPAANALLKTLEEPTERTRLILVTDQPHLLLETIRSRCQLLRAGALPHEDVLELLDELIAQGALDERDEQPDPATLEVAAGFGEGSVGRALELLSAGALAERAELVDRLESLRPRHPIDYLEMAEELGRGDGRDQLPGRLDLLKVFMRDVMRYQVSQGRAALINTDLSSRVTRWARALSTDEALAAIDALNEAEELLERNVNSQLITERALRKLRPLPDQLDLM